MTGSIISLRLDWRRQEARWGRSSSVSDIQNKLQQCQPLPMLLQCYAGKHYIWFRNGIILATLKNFKGLNPLHTILTSQLDLNQYVFFIISFISKQFFTFSIWGNIKFFKIKLVLSTDYWSNTWFLCQPSLALYWTLMYFTIVCVNPRYWVQ